MKIWLVATLAILSLSGCSQDSEVTPAAADAATANEFVTRVNREMKDMSLASGATEWLWATHISHDTGILVELSRQKEAQWHGKTIAESLAFQDEAMLPATRRALDLLKLQTENPAPSTPEKQVELSKLAIDIEGMYGAGEYCPEDGSVCLAGADLEELIGETRDYDKALDYWLGWRKVSVPMRDPFTRMVELTNEGARSLGYANLGKLWQSDYDMPAADFRAETERLWSQVEPLYKELHCHVRARLSAHYGEDKVPPGQTIPAHILGNMWGQTWQPIYDLVAPFPELPDTDASKVLVENNYSPQDMVRSAEEFYISLGFDQLPPSFWERSQFTKPRDREVQCHASAWGLEGGKDLRLKMCIYPTYEDLQDIYHELGHLFYFRAYSHQPPVFQDGAHNGFHEAVGNTVMLAMTPEYLQSKGLIEQAVVSEEAVINDQMLRALTDLACCPGPNWLTSGGGRSSRARLGKTNTTAPGGNCAKNIKACRHLSNAPKMTSIPAPRFMSQSTNPTVAIFWHRFCSFNFCKQCAIQRAIPGPCTNAPSTAVRKLALNWRQCSAPAKASPGRTVWRNSREHGKWMPARSPSIFSLFWDG